MSLFKRKVTERKATTHVVLHILDETQKLWPQIHESLKSIFKENFIVQNQDTAPFDLALASIAFDMQAVKNLFTTEQASRIEQYILEAVNSDEWGEYATSEIKAYSEKFQKDVKENNDPLGSIPARLLQRWLGENINKFTVKIDGKDTGVINPFLLMTIQGQLMTFVGNWKKIKDKFNLVEN